MGGQQFPFFRQCAGTSHGESSLVIYNSVLVSTCLHIIKYCELAFCRHTHNYVYDNCNVANFVLVKAKEYVGRYTFSVKLSDITV